MRESGVTEPDAKNIQNAFGAMNSASVVRKTSLQHLRAKRSRQPKHRYQLG